MSTALRTYYRGDELVGLRDGLSNSTRYYHFDHQGTTQCLTDKAGAVTDRFASDAWGVEVKRTGSSINRHWYVGNGGYYREQSTTSDYLRARYYSMHNSVWRCRDHWDTFAPYLYAQNSPALFVDLSGRNPIGPTSPNPFFPYPFPTSPNPTSPSTSSPPPAPFCPKPPSMCNNAQHQCGSGISVDQINCCEDIVIDKLSQRNPVSAAGCHMQFSADISDCDVASPSATTFGQCTGDFKVLKVNLGLDIAVEVVKLNPNSSQFCTCKSKPCRGQTGEIKCSILELKIKITANATIAEIGINKGLNERLIRRGPFCARCCCKDGKNCS